MRLPWDKIVAIDYDQKIITIRDSLSRLDSGYAKIDMKYRTGQPFIKVMLDNGIKRSEGWFLFDTGSKWSVSVPRGFVLRNHLDRTMKHLGTRRTKGTDGIALSNETVLLPKLIMGIHELYWVPIDLEKPSTNGGLKFGIMGNDVLKRFNVIIDYQNSAIYLNPNGSVSEPYNMPFPFGRALLLVTVTILALVFYLYRRRQREAPFNDRRMHSRR